MEESTRVGKFIFSTLSNAGIVAYEDPAPQGSAFPLVRFRMLSSVDTKGHAANQILVQQLWSVTVDVDLDTAGQEEALADGVYSALVGATGSVDGVIIYSVHREQSSRDSSTLDGVTYRRLTQTFRVFAQDESLMV